jgi:GAF domain-containing protein
MVASYPPGASVIPLRARLEELPAAAAVLQGAQPYVSSDPAGEGLLPPEFVQATGMRSVLAAPLIALDHRLGLLVGDGGERALSLSPDELELAMICANICGGRSTSPPGFDRYF